ncbi:efflux transporter outer membrane subunit [Sutterella massiliensis]|uniref:Efflux transporter outer membrane subunit n=1 Tax=Sutterella massiliensis TaxID=1816689 RepID=A0ABS2DP43_9BURK|nr:efflux transporter outer membrane subunit [Sutterella massiliensis]MBM6703131.1 efflux transporter outer membrane subunit [Sutterella massiliensis]
MNKMLRLMPLAAALLLAGCVNLAPTYERPASPIEEVWPQDGEAYAVSEMKRASLPRWQDFICDERLKTVIEEGLKNNRSLRQAALNVELARAQYGVQRSELFPTVAAVAQETAQRTPETTSALGESSTTHTYTAQLAMTSYEIDFFGRIRNLNEQALQAYLQSEDAHRTAQSSLIAEIAMAWLTLGADRAQLALQKETLASQEETYKLMEESFKAGAASRLDLEQARTTVTAARAAIASYVRAVAQDKNALDLLVGKSVDEKLLPTGLELNATLPASLPEGLPSEVLFNRPDIWSAERGMLSANAQIGAARAAFFPSFSLTAGIGSSALDLSDLFSGGSGMWSFTPNFTIPIFTGGLNLANLRAAEATQKIAVAQYEQTIQTAFREVRDALATEGTVEREMKAREEYADAAQKTYELSDARYKAGAAAYTEVLDAQRTAVAAKQVLISTQLSRASSLVTLYKVLGGGSVLPEDEASVQEAQPTGGEG